MKDGLRGDDTDRQGFFIAAHFCYISFIVFFLWIFTALERYLLCIITTKN